MLIIVGGPMFAGKTTWLLNHVQKLEPGTFQVFKPIIDTRYAKHEAVTHDGSRVRAKNLSVALPRFPAIPKKIHTILIDELNFFHPETLLPEVVKQLELGRTVIGAGLVYDFLKRPFGATLPLSLVADRFVRVYARCDGCGKKAMHSYRKFASKKALNGEVVLGAEEAYGACCASCWKKFNAKLAS